MNSNLYAENTGNYKEQKSNAESHLSNQINMKVRNRYRKKKLNISDDLL